MTNSMLYIMRERDTLFHKVGFSQNPINRLKELQVGNPRPLEIVYVRSFPTRYIKRVEATIHARLRYAWVSGEWFETELSNILKVIEDLYNERINLESVTAGSVFPDVL